MYFTYIEYIPDTSSISCDFFYFCTAAKCVSRILVHGL